MAEYTHGEACSHIIPRQHAHTSSIPTQPGHWLPAQLWSDTKQW